MGSASGLLATRGTLFTASFGYFRLESCFPLAGRFRLRSCRH